MVRTIPTGVQSFVKLRKDNLFYVDKTHFIKEWWNQKDDVTLITRPRRFGKTLMLDTVRAFFSPEFLNQPQLFDGLAISRDEELRSLRGTVPVIFLSFAPLKGKNYEIMIEQIKALMARTARAVKKSLGSSSLSEDENELFASLHKNMSDATAMNALLDLSELLCLRYNTLPLILLDEYDSPMHEAWLNGYWDEILSFMRGFFEASFKTNPNLGRGLLTGILRVSKESIFSDMNNLEVISITSDLYADSFGFTEKEVFAAMDEYSLSEKEEIKRWYDGFTFGSQKEIYNPWSIIGYLKHKKIAPYWAQTSSNAILGDLISQHTIDIKEDLISLLHGKTILTKLDENIVFSQLYITRGAIWSILMAAGYVKPVTWDEETDKFEVTLTNYEVCLIFKNLICNWFNGMNIGGNDFCQALLQDNLESMNMILEEIAKKTFSFFDISGNEPEKVYHAFVLGLTVHLINRYEIRSNRESGLGRYDILMFPKQKQDHGIIIEFKTNKKSEKNLQMTCANALKQIHNKEYTTDLIDRDIEYKNIYAYGFAFKGKDVLICGGEYDKIDWKSLYN